MLGRTKKALVDKNGTITNRWFKDSLATEPSRKIPNVSKHSDYETKYNRDKLKEEREANQKHREIYSEETKPTKSSDESKSLWLALYIAQGGNLDIAEYSSLNSLETPMVDSEISYPVGYGSGAVNSLIIDALTPSIVTEGESGDPRSGWEHGHGKVFILEDENGEIRAITNTRVRVTLNDVKIAKRIGNQKSIIDLANKIYSSYGLKPMVNGFLSSSSSDDIEQDQQENNYVKESKNVNRDKKSDKNKSVHETGVKNRTSYTDDSSIDRVLRDPLGVTDPYGVRDPLAGMIRNELGLGGFGFD